MMMIHVCKVCNKSFPCGMSLSDHMRSHEILNSTDFFENAGVDDSTTIDDVTDHSAYGLRQNPRKTWRFADPKNGGLQCKECGKVFQSMKALCGHMACHSEKGKLLSNNLEDQKLVTEDQTSDTETRGQRLTRRSKRLKYKKVVVDYSSVPVTNGNSSSVSGIEQEEEDGAMCLMILSRDSANWGGFNSVDVSSDNNSILLERRSLSNDMQIPNLKSGMTDFKDSDSGYFSIEGNFRNGGDFKKIKLKNRSGVEIPDVKFVNGIRKHGKHSQNESFKAWINEEGYNYDRDLMKFESRSNANHDVETCKKKAQKRSKYECFICNKILSSPQALGGHIASHRRNNNSVCFASTSASVSTNESGENNLETKNHDYQINDNNACDNAENKHECLVCFKIFKSGQALGGHKRIHMVGGSEYEANQIHDFLDLNLPPSMKD